MIKKRGTIDFNPGSGKIAILRYKEEFSLLMWSNAVAPEDSVVDRKENTPDPNMTCSTPEGP